MYESTTATHYAAYRPPFHNTILEDLLAISRERCIGLDIGCGTGRSTTALANYCNFVIGIDPSMEKLREAQAQQLISYMNALGENIPVADNSINIVSIAGSLNYINKQLLNCELNRICCHDAEIVVYDFEVQLTDFASLLKLENLNESQEYDHQMNLSEFPEFEEVHLVSEEVSFVISPSETTHLLLSSSDRHRALQKIYRTENLFEVVKSKIETNGTALTLKANIYYSLYSLAKN